jgi:hypothetical protein
MRSTPCAGAAAATVTAEELLGSKELHLDANAPR